MSRLWRLRVNLKAVAASQKKVDSREKKEGGGLQQR